MPMNKALTSSKYQHWCTPDWLWHRVTDFFGEGGILLDPCSNRWTSVKAARHLKAGGLSEPWGRNVYMNPPYKGIGPWMLKAAREGVANGPVIALVPARTDTKWWHGTVPDRALSVCFVKGRIVFERPRRHGPTWTAGFPSALILWDGSPLLPSDYRRKQRHRFKDFFHDIGWVV